LVDMIKKMNLFLICLLFFYLVNCKISNEDSPVYKLPSLSLLDWDGEEVSFQDFEGKVLIVDVWATWCTPCEKSVPVIEKLQESADDSYVFIGVNTDTDKSPDEIEAKANSWKMSYISLLDTHHVFIDLFQLEGLPTFLVFSKTGNLIYTQLGIKPSDYSGLKARMETWKSVD